MRKILLLICLVLSIAALGADSAAAIPFSQCNPLCSAAWSGCLTACNAPGGLTNPCNQACMVSKYTCQGNCVAYGSPGSAPDGQPYVDDPCQNYLTGCSAACGSNNVPCEDRCSNGYTQCRINGA